MQIRPLILPLGSTFYVDVDGDGYGGATVLTPVTSPLARA